MLKSQQVFVEKHVRRNLNITSTSLEGILVVCFQLWDQSEQLIKVRPYRPTSVPDLISAARFQESMEAVKATY